MTTPFSPAEQTAAAKEFAAFWQGKGYEKGHTQPFWLHLLRVLGVETPESFIEFEDAARMDEANGFIDAFIPSTHVLVEQKSLGRDLRAPIRQSDGTFLTPFQQARRYSASLPYSQRPRPLDPADLLAAHRANDRAVMSAYGFDVKMTESDCVAELFKLYQTLAASN